MSLNSSPAPDDASFPKFLSAPSHSEQVYPLLFTDVSYHPTHASVPTYYKILAFLLLKKYLGRLAAFGMAPWLPFYRSPIIHFPSEMVIFRLCTAGLNLNKWWDCCSTMAGLSPCHQLWPIHDCWLHKVCRPLIHAHMHIHMQERNKAINKRAVVGNICLPKHCL